MSVVVRSPRIFLALLASLAVRSFGLVEDSRQFAEVGGDDGLRAAPDEEEEGFATPTAGGVADDEAGALCGGEGGLRGAEDKAVGPAAELVVRASRLLANGGEEGGFKFLIFAE